MNYLSRFPFKFTHICVVIVLFGLVLAPIQVIQAGRSNMTESQPVAPQVLGNYSPDAHEILKDLTFRQALAYCTDRHTLARAAYPLLSNAEIDALMTDSFLPPDHWAYTAPSTHYGYNPTQGKALLEFLNWSLPEGATYRVNEKGEELALVLTTSNAALRIAYGEVLELQWKDCGIRLERLHSDSDWLFGDTTGVKRSDFELASFAWIWADDDLLAPYYACDQVPTKSNGWQGYNYNGWCNSAATDAAFQGDNLSLTQEQRRAYYAILQEEYAQDLPALTLFKRTEQPKTVEHLTFNFYYPPPPPTDFKDVEFRRALAYCTDRNAITRAVYPTLSQTEIAALEMDSFFPQDHWAYTQPGMLYPYDPEEGKMLLENLGWTLPQGATFRVNSDGDELALVLTTSSSLMRYLYGEILEAQWEICGINLVRFHASPEWMFAATTGVQRRNFDLTAFAWDVVYDDTVEISGLYACDKVPSALNDWPAEDWNYMGWCNPAASQAAYLGDNASLTEAQRKAYYAQVQEEFSNQVPSIPLFKRPGDIVYWEHIDFNLFDLNETLFLPMNSK